MSSTERTADRRADETLLAGLASVLNDCAGALAGGVPDVSSVWAAAAQALSEGFDPLASASFPSVPSWGAFASRPPASGPPASGPPASGPPASGPPASGPPASGPPASGPPASGPLACEAAMLLLDAAEDPLAPFFLIVDGLIALIVEQVATDAGPEHVAAVDRSLDGLRRLGRLVRRSTPVSILR